MRIIVRPAADPHREIDMTDHLVAAIAEELWRLYGGDCAQAECRLQGIAAEATAEAGTVFVVAGPAAGQASVRRWNVVSRDHGSETGGRRCLLAALPTRCTEERTAVGAA